MKPNTAPTGSPLRAGHLGQGMKDLVDQRVGIDYPYGPTRKVSGCGAGADEGGGARRAEDEISDFGFRISDFCFRASSPAGGVLPSASKPGSEVCRVP